MRNEFNNQMLPLRNQTGSSVPGATRTEQGVCTLLTGLVLPSSHLGFKGHWQHFLKSSEILEIWKSVHKSHEELWVVEAFSCPLFHLGA